MLTTQFVIDVCKSLVQAHHIIHIMRKVAFTLRQITRRKMVVYVKNFQLMSALVTSLDGKKPVFHAALALGQNPGIDNLANLV